jgi:hypothetical protein
MKPWQREAVAFILGMVFAAFLGIWIPTIPFRIVTVSPFQTPPPPPVSTINRNTCSNDGGKTHFPC